MKLAKITFVLIKDKQVVSAETIDAEEPSVARRLSKIQYEGFDMAVVVFGEGAKWDISFPMSEAEIEKTATKLFRNI